jgi:hypothetical protein
MNNAESWPENLTSHYQKVEQTLEDYRGALAGEKVVHWWGDERDNVYLTQTLRPDDVLHPDDLGVMSAGIEDKFIADIGVEYKGAMTKEMLAQRIDDLTRGNMAAQRPS